MLFGPTSMTKDEFLRALAGGDAADSQLANEPVRRATVHVEGTERAIRRLQVWLSQNHYKAQLDWAPLEGRGANA